MARFVLEIGSEEVPARFLKGEREALQTLFEQALADARLEHGSIKVMATPRRLTLIAEDLPETQPVSEIILIGPPAAIAYDANGTPTRALLSFASGNGVDPAEIFIHKTDKGEYAACRKQGGGAPTAEALAQALPVVIQNIPFARSMRWGNYDVPYARPLRWLLALLDSVVVPFHVGAIASGRQSFGHRVHGQGPFSLEHARDYERMASEECQVTADQDRRTGIIREKGGELARAAGGEVIWKDALLEEVSGLVEHPVPLLADFDPSYLEIPEEVLLTSMQSHQKSFGIRGKDGRLLPHFLTVLNVNPPDPGLVKRGWERVLRARLEDARFFWRTDLEASFDAWRQKLEHVIFIGPLGSMAEKCDRLERLCVWLAERLMPQNFSQADAARAGALAKADLVSAMVGEFDTLQGIMGGIYAARMGENEVVAKAIAEQYLPAGPDTPLPESAAGAILSVADKADTLAGCFGLGMIPTGAADPNGLRRCALGIIRIFIARNWHFDVTGLFRQARKLYGERGWKLDSAEADARLREFLEGRLRNYFISQGYDTLQADAVLYAGAVNPADAKARLDALAAFSASADFPQAAQTLKRVENMGKKAAKESEHNWNDALLQDDAEKALAATLGQLLPKLDASIASGDYATALASIASLREPVDAFFDKVLVLCDDQAVRENRLKMLNAMRARFDRIARFSVCRPRKVVDSKRQN